MIKYICEFVGTMMLILLGDGAASICDEALYHVASICNEAMASLAPYRK